MKTKMQLIMSKAQEIAYNAVKKFGGKAKEYMQMSLKMAWAWFKKGMVEIAKVLKYESDYLRADVYATEKDGKLSVRKEFGTYNHRRYSAPWGAVITLVNGKLNFDFNGYYTGSQDGSEEGDVYVTANSIGNVVVAFGQKDNRGNGTSVIYYHITNDCISKISKDQAYKLLA